jgi:hypothetical protein
MIQQVVRNAAQEGRKLRSPSASFPRDLEDWQDFLMSGLKGSNCLPLGLMMSLFSLWLNRVVSDRGAMHPVPQHG